MHPGYRTILLAALTSTLPAVYAQGVYKTIGPDGKVVYSDQPPATPGTKVDVIRTPAASKPSPATAAQAAASTPVGEPWPGRTTDAKKAVAVGRTSPEPAAARPDPALAGAVYGVLGLKDLVSRTLDLCAATLPTSFKRYGDASAAWAQRNAEITSKAQSAYTGSLDATERSTIDAAIRAKNDSALSQVTAAPTASRIRWCDQSVDAINGGAMDPRQKPNLVRPLLAARTS